MPLIQKPALHNLYTRLVAEKKPVDAKVLDDIVAIVGDRRGLFGSTSSETIARELASKNLTPAQKIALAQKGLDATERADLQALLADDAFGKMLDPAARSFLRAILGLEPAPLPSATGEAPAAAAVETPKVVADPSAPEVQAAQKLRELVKTGEIKRWYDAVIDAVDEPELKKQALDLFGKLPVVKPGMAADDFVRAGLWAQAPKGVEEMEKSARYLPGRQVLCETTCFATVPARSDVTYEQQRRKIGSYDPNGVLAVTYRATLVGEDPQNKNNFLVAVDGPDGKPVNVSVTKESIYKHNQPRRVDQSHIQSDTKRDAPYGGWGSWQVDFASPLARAKLCECAIKMDEIVQKLDFRREKVESKGTSVFGRGAMAEKMVDLQQKCVEIVFRSINMKYPREDGKPFTDPGRAPQGNRDVARQAIRGTGMCVQQSTVFGALMTPFMDVLGVDGQFRSGNCFRNIRGASPNVYAPDYSSGHGWWQLTFRPSMKMSVTDRTWDQVNLDLDRAYGFPYGDRYANENINGYTQQPLTSTDVNVSGDVTVATMERQFSQVGDGRENHISLRQDN